MGSALGTQGAPEPSAFEMLMRIQDSFYDKGMTYSKVILGLGYAGMLTIFAGTKQYLRPRQLLWTAAMISVSLIAYVLFEVGQMLFVTVNAWTLKKTIEKSGANQAAAVQSYSRAVQKRTPKLLKYWAITLAICLPTGLAAGGVLIWTFFQRLLTMH